MEKQGALSDKEVFIFTDNSTFEGTFYKGHSTSEKLCDVILRLRLVQQRSSCILHVTHVAGTRMKEAGIDGLSRGDLMEGMLKSGEAPWRFLPLSQDADDEVGRQGSRLDTLMVGRGCFLLLVFVSLDLTQSH